MQNSGSLQINEEIRKCIAETKFRKSWYVDEKNKVAKELGYDNFLEAYVDMHLNQNKASREIGKTFDVHGTAVLYRLRKVKCPIRPKGGNNTHSLRFLKELKCATPMCTVLRKKHGKWAAVKTTIIDNGDGTATCPKCKTTWNIKE